MKLVLISLMTGATGLMAQEVPRMVKEPDECFMSARSGTGSIIIAEPDLSIRKCLSANGRIGEFFAFKTSIGRNPTG